MIQTGSHEVIHLLGTMPGGKQIESELHHKFSRERIRGEWFNPSVELLAYIERAALTS